MIASIDPEKKNYQKDNRRKRKKSSINILKKELEEEQKRFEAYRTKYLYLQADFENYMKRKEKEIDELKLKSNENLVINLLEILDEFDLALESCDNMDNKNPIFEGIRIVQKKMVRILENEGLKKIDTIGNLFDPEEHEAVSTIKTNDYIKGTILEETRKGYTYQNRVIRPSMVKIAK